MCVKLGTNTYFECWFSSLGVLMIDLRFKKLTEDAIPFKYSREYDACMDMYSNEDVVIHPNEIHIVPTGIALQIPAGYEGIVRGRSGLASKGIFAHIGTIDENYRGNVGAILVNLSDDDFHITKGMRIAQFTVKQAFRIGMTESEYLSETSRGENGYGSSGL